MHGRTDQNRSVNVLRPAALTLAVPLSFVVHVCVLDSKGRLDSCLCVSDGDKAALIFPQRNILGMAKSDKSNHTM